MHANGYDTERSSLGHMPQGRWQFDALVTAVFGDMLERSIPQYAIMRRCVFDLGRAVVPPDSLIVDLGCSRGDGLAPFVSTLGDRNRYLGIDVSPPMLAAAADRFRDEIEQGLVRISELDLRTGYPQGEAALTLCVLSLQFTPIEHRQRILHDAYKNTAPGGAFILVEKVLGATAEMNARMVDIYHTLKREAGYTAEEVERKKLSLEGVLVPVTARWNEEFLRAAGFREVDCFWRWMNFAGWIATK
jgi:tRNA (cmo5U34)-methyltransferase